jgi:hypothetical protein
MNPTLVTASQRLITSPVGFSLIHCTPKRRTKYGRISRGFSSFSVFPKSFSVTTAASLNGTVTVFSISDGSYSFEENRSRYQFQVVHSYPDHPNVNGKVERWNRTLSDWMSSSYRANRFKFAQESFLLLPVQKTLVEALAEDCCHLQSVTTFSYRTSTNPGLTFFCCSNSESHSTGPARLKFQTSTSCGLQFEFE